MLRRRKPSRNGILKFGFIVCLAMLPGWSTSSGIAQETDTEKQAFTLHDTAANAQNENEYEFAAKQWQKLLDTYPDSKAARKAALNQGRCFYALKNYDSAILAFKKALPILREDQSPAIPELLLGLGYSRIQEGRRLADLDPQESASQFTTAANDLNTILLDHEDSPNANAAAYHRGQALEELGQLDQAKAAYQQSLDFKKDDLQIEAMYALGRINLEEGEYENAGRWYDRIRTVAVKTDGHRLLNDTNLNYADALINIGLQQLKKSDTEDANRKFAEAKTLLAEVTGDDKFDLRDNALFLDASCSMYLGDDAEAAKLFESVSKIENSKLKDKSLVLAGSSWLKAGDETRGVETLQRAIDSKSSFAVDAVHSMAMWLIKNGRDKEAFELTDKWVPLLDQHPLAVDVLLDRANASRGVPELADRSAALYAQIAADHPSHELAPKSLYWSAFSDYDAKQYDAAIAKADQFEKAYPGDSFLPFMREVRGDSLLMQGKHGAAEIVFRDLANDFQNDKENRSSWITRAGYASYLQGNFDETIQWLESQDASITQPKDKAESLYWIGSSLYEKERYADALQKLQQSMDIDRNWHRTPEVMLALCNAQLKQSQFDQAEATAASMLKLFPNNPDETVSRSLYAVGDDSLAAKDFDRAIRNFDLISNRFEKSELAPYAIYRAALAALENNDSKDASKRFADLMKKYPEHELAEKSQLARTSALRKSGDTTESIAALKTLVAEAKDDTNRQNANYQLGLSYVDARDWPNAIATLSSMTDSLKPDSPNADKIWYELAWAQRENGDAEGSLKSFATLVEKFPSSSDRTRGIFPAGLQGLR